MRKDEPLISYHSSEDMASSTWLKSFLGISVDDDELQHISQPISEYGVHVTLRYVQAGSVLGVGILGPLMALCEPGVNVISVARMAGKCGKTAALFGFVLGPVVTMFNVRNMNMEQITETCYHYRYHQPQLIVDRMSVAGLGVGSLIGKLAGGNIGYFGAIDIVGGLIVGEYLSLSENDNQLKI